MEEFKDHLLHVLAFPLRGHVADAVNGREVEVVGVGGGVAGDLAVGGPGLPARGHGPLERLDPAAGSNCRHNAISVARVVHECVSVSLEDSVDPNRCLASEGIVEEGVGRATFPTLDALRNVECSSNISTVQIVTHGIAKRDFACCLLKEKMILQPRSVLLEANTSLISLNLTVDNGFSVCLLLLQFAFSVCR